MSSSVLLTKHLEKESEEMKKYIGDFLEEKVKEFSDGLKDKIGQLVNRRILSFYNSPSHQCTLFDSDGESILKGVETAFTKVNWTPLLQEYQSCLKQKNKRCFHVQIQDSSYFFFEQCVVVTGPHYLYPCSDQSGLRFSVFHHSLHADTLQSIKHFQLFRPGNLEQGLTLYRVHPEFFHSNSTDFEEVCSKEYHEIREKKKQLEKDIQRVEEERQELNKEKKQWLLVKQKMTRMRLELAKEKSQFEKVKREEWDCFLEEVD